MEIVLLDANRQPLSVVDRIIDFEVIENLYTADTFQLRIPLEEDSADLFVNNRYLTLSNVKPSGTVEQFAFIIDTVERDTDSGTVSISGTDIGGLFSVRRCMPPQGQMHDRQVGSLEDRMIAYVRNNAGNTAETARRIPGLTFSASQGRGQVGTSKLRFQALSDTLEALSQAGQLGWRVVLDNFTDSFVFEAFKGTDRSNEVVFELPLESTSAQRLLRSTKDQRNEVYVAGQGRGAKRQLIRRYYGQTENPFCLYWPIGETPNINRPVNIGNVPFSSNAATVEAWVVWNGFNLTDQDIWRSDTSRIWISNGHVVDYSDDPEGHVPPWPFASDPGAFSVQTITSTGERAIRVATRNATDWAVLSELTSDTDYVRGDVFSEEGSNFLPAVGLVYAWQDANNWDSVYIHAATNTVYYRHMRNGTPTDGVLASDSRITSNEWYTLDVRRFGTAASLTITGGEDFELTAVTIPGVSLSGNRRYGPYSDGQGNAYANDFRYRPFNRPGYGDISVTLGAATAVFSHALPYNEWAHIAATYSGGTTRLYVNGTLVSSLTVAAATLGPFNNSRIGGTWQGNIDEFKLWTSSRGPSSITQYIDNEISGPPWPATLYSYYRMNEGTGTTITDLVSGRNGTLSTGVQWRLSGAPMSMVGEPQGIARREAFMDSRDTGDFNTQVSRADEELEASVLIDSFECDIDPYGSFRYNEDWELGDTVMVRNTDWGVSESRLITSVRRKFNNDDVIEIETTLGQPWPKLSDQVAIIVGKIEPQP